MTDNETEKSAGGLSPTSGAQEYTNAASMADFLGKYEKCITCRDLGRNCWGPKLEELGTLSNVREHHRRLRTGRKIKISQICEITHKEISDATVKDYFSHEEKDFRWTTVSLIDNALTSLCGEGEGALQALQGCPATSTELKEQLADVTDKLRISEEQCFALQAKIAENKGKHIEQLNKLQQDNQASVEWLKADVRLWRKVAFALLGVSLIVIIALIAYVAMDLATPDAGFFRK